MMYDRQDVIVAGLLLGGVVFFLILFGGVVWQEKARSLCLEHGYPDMRASMTFDAYCIRIVNQTQVLVRLEDIRK